MPEERNRLLQGTLELLVLRVLSVEAMHGWGIGERIAEITGEVLVVNQGSLYPALQRLRSRGWVRTEWHQTENNRRARYYVLTKAGAKQLGLELAAWREASEAVERVLAWRPVEA